MNEIKFNPRWREELVALSDEGVLIPEIAMGTLHVYFPDEKIGCFLLPVGQVKNVRFTSTLALRGVKKTIFRYL